jgi:L-2,4-diaminobutyric acid acetyltransferase
MQPPSSLSLTVPSMADGAAIHALVRRCPPLDLNSTYAYVLLCVHHAATCVVARDGTGAVRGFISAYRKPTDPRVLFVWQVAVDAEARGQGLAGRMLGELLARPGQPVLAIETTVSPDNAPSRALFRRFAERIGARCIESEFMSTGLFGDENHEAEDLFRLELNPSAKDA